MKSFKYMSKHKFIAEVIDIVEVRDGAGDLLSLQSVLDVLRKTKNISCLTLRFTFPPHLMRLPQDVRYRNLTLLSVNAPHSVVTPFLMTHPQLTDLTLGSCGAPSCALVDSPLPFIQSLTCPPGCVQGLISAGSRLTRLSLTHQAAEDATFPVSQLFNFHVIQTSQTLTVLDISFVHSTSELLQRISAAAPALIVLRLTESSFAVEVRFSGCDTNDYLLTK